MTHVLLVNTPDIDTFSNEKFGEQLGLLYLEASLKRAGYNCSIIDGKAYDLSYENILKEILLSPPSLFLGFSIFAQNINSSIKIIKDLRKEGFKKHIILGGMWASFKYRQILSQIKEVDSVCVGEGEEVAVELADAISQNITSANIKGLASGNEGKGIIFTPRKFRENIDDLPVPDRRGYYLEVIKKKNSISILFSRGCHRRCSYCSISSYIKLCGGKTWRPRSPVEVVDEMEYLLNTTEVKKFEFMDDNFLGPDTKDIERYYTFAEEIIRRKLGVKFSITCRIDVINYELLKKLKDAGLSEVNLGVESLSEAQLKRYNKRLTLEEISRALEILDKLHLPYTCFMMPMDPYVTREEIIENLDRMEKHRHEDHFSVYGYFWSRIRLDPYLPLFKTCLEDNLIKDFAPESLDDYSIPYIQFHPGVEGIIETAKAISNIYFMIMREVISEGKKKRMPFYQWNRIEQKISDTLKKILYKYFREYIDSGETSGGKEFIHEKMNKSLENIRSFAEEIKREDIIDLKEHIINIDGIKISTRPEGFNELISRITEKIV